MPEILTEQKEPKFECKKCGNKWYKSELINVPLGRYFEDDDNAGFEMCPHCHSYELVPIDGTTP